MLIPVVEYDLVGVSSDDALEDLGYGPILPLDLKEEKLCSLELNKTPARCAKKRKYSLVGVVQYLDSPKVDSLISPPCGSLSPPTKA